MTTVASLEEVRREIDEAPGVMLYFSTPECNVCKALKPKISDAFAERFPKIAQRFVDATDTPDIAAAFQVFSVPTILVFLEGREFARGSRNISVAQFVQQIERPYRLMTA